MEIFSITSKQMIYIIENMTNPDLFGLFIVENPDGTCTCCDNLYGHAWTEDFPTTGDGIRWLTEYE